MRAVRTLILTIFLGSCLTGDLAPDMPTWGTFTCSVDGEEWGERYVNGYQTVLVSEGTYSEAIPCPENHYSIGSSYYDRQGYLRESIRFIKVPLSPGRYRLVGFNLQCENDLVYGYFSTRSAAGELIGDLYGVMESPGDYIIIDAFDPDTREVTGRFQVTFMIESRSPTEPSGLPDTVRFTDGKFHTKILL